MKDLFFQNVSEHCNYMDPKSVRSMYIGLGKYIIQELRRNGEAVLPDIGKFHLKHYKERVQTLPSGESHLYPDVLVVKFKPHRRMKLFFNNNPNIR